MPELAYLISPYTSPSPAMRDWRFKEACKAVASLLSRGILVVSPVAHSHPIAVLHGVGLGWEHWRALDLALLARCQRVIVLKLPLWEESVGIKAELAEAERLGIPVEFMEP